MILTIKLDDFGKVDTVKITQKRDKSVEDIRLVYHGQRGAWKEMSKTQAFEYLKVYAFHNLQVHEKMKIHKSENKEKATSKAINKIIGYDLY